MSGLFSSYTGDGDILRAIGLGHLEDKEIEKEAFLKQIKGSARLIFD